MKNFHLSFILFLSGFFSVHAQTPPGSPIPNGFKPGVIMMHGNITHNGYIKNNMKKNGEIVFLSSDGKKTKYTAAQLYHVTVDSKEYIISNNAFYHVIADGAKIKLLQKASNSSAIQYNGSEPIVADAGEGSYDDYFIQTAGTTKLQLVRKKDFAKIFSTVCADCPTLTHELSDNKLGFEEIEQAVALYNACPK
jgi:hypothetical protein